MIIDTPRKCIVAVDPGGTTGVAAYDGWSERLVWDQLDCGHGSGDLSTRDKKSRKTAAAHAYDYVAAMEYAAVTAIVNLIIAMGPYGTLVIEDFVLLVGGQGVSGKREGLSPVRVTARLLDRCEALGVFNGDVWRRWQWLGITGMDKRGTIVTPVGKKRAELPLEQRYAAVGDMSGEGAWHGGGWDLEMQMPSEAKGYANDERMKRWGFWVPGKPHATDALRHWVKYERSMERIPVGKPERIGLLRSDLRGVTQM